MKRFAVAFLLVFGVLCVTAAPAFAHKVKVQDTCEPYDGIGPSYYHSGSCGETKHGTTILRPHRHIEDTEEYDACVDSLAGRGIFPSDENKAIYCPKRIITEYDTEEWNVRFGQVECKMYDFSPISTTVDCFEFIFDVAAKEFITTVTGQFGKYVQALAALGIIILGIKIVFGSVPLVAETGVLAFKLAIVFAFANNPQLIETWMGFIKNGSREFSSVVSNAILADGVHSTFEDLLEVKKNLPGSSSGATYRVVCSQTDMRDDVFRRLDCIIQHTIASIKDGDPEEKIGMITMGAVMMGSLFLGGWGAIIPFVALWSMLLLAFTIVQAVMIYLVSMIAISFLAALTPIILPLWFFGLFRGMLSNWGSYLLMYSIQPVIMFAFLAMTVTVLSSVTYEFQELNKYIERNASGDMGKRTARIFDTGTMSVNPDEIAEFLQQLQHMKGLDLTQAPVQGETGYLSFRSADNGTGVHTITTMDPKDINELFDMKLEANMVDITDPQKRQLIALCIAYFVLLYMMFSFLKTLPQMLDRLISRIFVPSAARSTFFISKAHDDITSGMGRQLGKK